MRHRLVFSFFCFLLPGLAQGADSAVLISPARIGPDGIHVHDITSPFQAGSTRIRVLLPEKLDDGKKYPVIYVLPVEALDGNHYGDGLFEIKMQDLHNKAAAIFVAPTFSHLPWYADHPTNPQIRQETYFLKVVLPFVEQTYPARSDTAGRLLLGFSKSGWGAFSLILRHPDVFARAAAWDAPLAMDKPNRYATGEIFGTQKNFEDYQITRLLEKQAASFHERDRLILLGYGNFRQQMRDVDALMMKLKIDHRFHDGPSRSHLWGSGWVPQAVELLLAPPPG
jgi:S-formylglutathione hydrolase FrmB